MYQKGLCLPLLFEINYMYYRIVQCLRACGLDVYICQHWLAVESKSHPMLKSLKAIILQSKKYPLYYLQIHDTLALTGWVQDITMYLLLKIIPKHFNEIHIRWPVPYVRKFVKQNLMLPNFDCLALMVFLLVSAFFACIHLRSGSAFRNLCTV